MDRVSALMDGELDDEPARHVLARMSDQEEFRDCWDTYHLIGDALRGERRLLPPFGQSLAVRLAQEPTVLAPKYGRVKRLATYSLSAAASLSAMSLVAWVALSTGNPVAPPAEIAMAPAAPVAVVPVAEVRLLVGQEGLSLGGSKRLQHGGADDDAAPAAGFGEGDRLG